VNIDEKAAVSSVAVTYGATDTARIADDGTLTFAPVIQNTSITVMGVRFTQQYY